MFILQSTLGIWDPFDDYSVSELLKDRRLCKAARQQDCKASAGRQRLSRLSLRPHGTLRRRAEIAKHQERCTLKEGPKQPKMFSGNPSISVFQMPSRG